MGERAPDVRLASTHGDTFVLSEAVRNGPVLVAFIPGAFTSVCTREMCAFTDTWTTYESLGVQVVGVSPDIKQVQRAWSQHLRLKVPLVSDWDRRAILDYGVAWESGWGHTTKRAVFLVDGAMVVRYRWVSEDPDVEPPYDELLMAVRALR